MVNEKQALRAKMKRLLSSIESAQMHSLSCIAVQNITKHPAYKAAGTILCYAALPFEANPALLVAHAQKAGKVVAFPFCEEEGYAMQALVPEDEHAWEIGKYGIRTPVLAASTRIAPSKIDLIVVPGLAFDARGGRLGKGAGYYDRYFCKTHAFRMGFGISVQLVQHVPMDTFDIYMDAVVTD